MTNSNKSAKDINYCPIIANLREAFIYCQAVFDTDNHPDDFILLDSNPTFEKLTGFDKHKTLGKRIKEILPDFMSGSSVLVEAMKKVVLSGNGVEFEHYLEFSNKWFSISISYAEQNRCFIIFHEITHLKSQFEYLRAILDMSPDLIVITDLNGNVMDCNNKVLEVHGYSSKAQLTGKNALNLFAPSCREAARNDIISRLPTGYFTSTRYLLLDKAGLEFPVEMSFSLLRDKQNTPAGCVAISKDITERERMEEELKELTHEYETVFNGTQDVLFLIDVCGHTGEFSIKRVNESYERATGLLNEFTREKTPKELMGELAGKHIEENYMRCVLEKRPVSYEETLDLPVGRKVWYTTLSPIIKNGNVVNIVGSTRDITKSKEAEEALAKEKEALQISEEKFNKAFHSSPAAIAISTLNEGIFLEANNTFLEIYGYSREELIGKSALDLNIWINEEDRALFVNKFWETGSVRNREMSFRVKSGKIRTFLMSVERIILNRVECIISSLNDITSRKEAEETVKLSEEKLRAIFGSSPNPATVIDLNGVILDCNQETLNLLEVSSKEELVGKAMLDFVIPQQHKALVLQRDLLLQQGVVKNVEYTLVTKSGKEIIVESSCSIIRTSKGIPESLIIISRDISERKISESQIRYLSYHDKLTGLYNRAFFEQELQRLDTEQQLPLSLIIGDLNGLKLTNDVFGHYEGDKLLQNVAQILKSACRKEDIIARWGGDEFAIILPQTSNNHAMEVCDRISKLCSDAEMEPIKPSIALGYATKEVSEHDIHQTLKEAENWMYRHKLLDHRSVRSSIIASLEKTLFERNYETEEHAKRIRQLSLKLGKAMRLSNTELDELNLLSLLHDIGKIGISDSILMKPGKLTPEEWEEMKKHPEIGFRIAQSSQELAHIADYILSHHERWDGGGYPRGLKGTDIPKLSRIIAVIDAYDVMTHARPYKGIASHEEAIAEIKKCSGQQFDPLIADEFIRMMCE